ncbi:hypothetical protein MSAN_00421900 [Mycena sanguinolenta]|uniref:F-box domain-containing protein n=1 Tax=Mycena sanguinolenta TaxID=230812 RepID=A0A8H6ZCX8_9AGAR|nr:hypothetical protein MSAN_00421900 [Mycena sanguinolenta]
MAQHESTSTTTVVVFPSGINQLPAELFVEIFAFCWRSFTPRFDDIYAPSRSKEHQDNPTPAYKTEIARLAHAPLLTVAQVCAKWRSIAIGTSFLWCDIELDTVLWDTPNHCATAVALLESILIRGGKFPLHVSLTEGEHPFPLLVFTLLAAHSQRWETFSCPSYFLDAFSGIQGKLPRLRELLLDPGEEEMGSLDVWSSMPSLTSLALHEDILTYDMHALPLKQLRQLECTTVDGYETRHALSLMPLLPTAAEVRLRIHLFDKTDGEWSEIDFLTSDISMFYLELAEDFDADYSLEILECILHRVTLPLLTRFELESSNYPHCPLLWPHRAFLALSARSSFGSTLQTLEIYEVHMTEQQLLQCLLDLPSLKRLAISDHQRVAPMPGRAGEGVNEVLITNALFLKLARTADSSCLVPRLSSLGCQTLMRFDDHALLTLAVSRLSASSDAGQPPNATGPQFGIELSWLPGHERKIDEDILARFRALKISSNRRFTFRISAAEDEWVN